MSYIVYGKRPSQIDTFKTLKRTDNFVLDRVFTPDCPFCIRTFEYREIGTYVRYMYFADITSMFNAVDFIAQVDLFDLI